MGGGGLLPGWAPHKARQGGVGGQRLCQSLGGEQSILLSPFSCSAISCPAPAPACSLHLLLLNHFLFTACLLRLPSSSGSRQPSRAPDGCLGRRGADDRSLEWKLPPWSFLSGCLINVGAGEHGPASPRLGHGPGRRKRTLPWPRLTHGSVSHPLLGTSHVL